MDRALLVAAKNVMELVPQPVKLVINVQDGAARITENCIDAFTEQCLAKYRRSAHRLRFRSGRFIANFCLYFHNGCHSSLLYQLDLMLLRESSERMRLRESAPSRCPVVYEFLKTR